MTRLPLAALGLVVLLSACSPRALDPSTPSAVATPIASPSAAAVAEGWVVHEGDGFTIATPPDWEPVVDAEKTADGDQFLLSLLDVKEGLGLSITHEPGFESSEAGAKALSEAVLADIESEPVASSPQAVTAGAAWVVVGKETIGKVHVLFPTVLIPAQPRSFRLTFVAGESAEFGPEDMLQIANTFTLTDISA